METYKIRLSAIINFELDKVKALKEFERTGKTLEDYKSELTNQFLEFLGDEINDEPEHISNVKIVAKCKIT